MCELEADVRAGWPSTHVHAARDMASLPRSSDTSGPLQVERHAGTLVAAQ